MTASRGTGTAHRLLALLEEERAALCSANLDRVAELGTRKLHLLSALDRKLPGAAEVETLRHAARRNARLLAAALDGLREGAGRSQAIHHAPAGFNAYDSAGRSRQIATSAQPGGDRRV